MPPRQLLRHFPLVCALTLLLSSPAWAQPRDEQEFELLTEETSELVVESLLELVANEFGAVALCDPAVAQMRLRFSNRARAPLTWGTIKDLLRFYEVRIVEKRSPKGPWQLLAVPTQGFARRVTPPYTFVQGQDLPRTEELVTAVFQIQNGAGATIFTNLRNLMSRDPSRAGLTLFVQGPELLILTDTTSKIRYYRRLIEALDVAGPRKTLEVFQIHHAPVAELAQIVTTLLASLSGSGLGPSQGPARPQGQQGARPDVIADPRTNQLLVAAFPIDFPIVKRVINALDLRAAPSQSKFHVYRCKDGDAEELAEKLAKLFNGQAGASGGAPRPSAGLAASAFGPVETRVVADERTNSLLIQAEPPVYEHVLELLAELDRKRRRVLIEAEVWEITTPTDQMTIAFELAGLTSAKQGSTRPAGLTSFGLSSPTPVTNESGEVTRLGRTPNVGAGLSAVLTRDSFDKLPVIVSAIANFERVNLVTRPFALTNDNKEATFAVTDSQPFLKTNLSQVAATQDVDFVDASSKLTIKPQVNSDDNLTLEVSLEISSFSGSGSANLPPGTNSRTYTGEVTVPNGKYIVFGGLESETDRYVEAKVPFLGDLPILGHLFKSWSSSKSKSQIYIFIRPTIFNEDSFAAEAALSGELRERAHVDSQRVDWLPPVVADRFRKGAGFTLQDEAFTVFGTGTGNPFLALR